MSSGGWRVSGAGGVTGVANSRSGPERRRTSRARVRARQAADLATGDRLPRQNRYRDVLLVIAVVFMGLALWVAQNATSTANRATHEADRAIARVQAGRQVSVGITCAALSAISEAGRRVIGNPMPDTPFTRTLERLGYPSYPQRVALARQAADKYVEQISGRVNESLAEHGKRPVPGLVRGNGTINCRVLANISAVPPFR